jgi:2-keto-4-pentenoate hydratase
LALPATLRLLLAFSSVQIELEIDTGVNHDTAGFESGLGIPITMAKSEIAAISTAFLEARRAALAMREFPGALPATLAEAYAVQDTSIEAWGDVIAGWKIGLVPAPLRTTYGAERLAGPIFGLRLQTYRPGTVARAPFIAGGYGALEAEFVLRLSADIPATDEIASDEAASRYVGAMHAGVELAGSPLKTINEQGPTSVVSDFGNNSGLIVGPEIPGWRWRPLESLGVRMIIDGRMAGEGSAAKVLGGPLAALRFLIENCRMRRRPLRAGMYVSTGAVTGIHEVRAGARAIADFEDFGTIEVAVETASA